MEAFCTMIQGDLPPVGHKISLQVSKENPLQELLGMHQYWVDSGTSALALALCDAKERFAHVKNPRAIIPGYCCPDLVAACVYAGVEPVAIDINANDPSYDFEQLRAHLDSSVIAIVAVNFLGLAERLTELRQLISDSGLQTLLIEDNAQWFPAAKEEAIFSGDYVVFSFGRGKPLSLLGGGLLLSADPLDSSVVRKIAPPAPVSALLPIKIRAYNYLLNPALYLLLNRNPLLSLGKTEYHPLDDIRFMDDFRMDLLSENFNAYQLRPSEAADAFHSRLSACGLQKLVALDSPRARRMLRYPLLCAQETQRDTLLEKLNKAGLGATAMYATDIDKVSGVEGLVTLPVDLTNAGHFARRLVTLPVHAGVTQFQRERILQLLAVRA
jgi:dTDP-4-amino-4,6-dideoxygalactose transaminase